MAFVERAGARLTALRKALPLKWTHLDALGAVMAFCYGLPSLAYAFGRDQGIFFYVGREWAAGRLPYTEAFDIKPPGIYFVYALAGRLFGNQTWSIRILELLAVLLLGFGVGHALKRDRPRLPGELGAIMLITSGFYYTVFDYWDTGQVEFWEGLFALAGYVAALQVRSVRQAALLAGLCGGVAVMFKTPVVVMLPVAGFVVLVRAYRAPAPSRLLRVRNTLLAFALHCLGGFGIAALVVGYFALRGGWPALVELVGYTSTYVKNTQVGVDDSIRNITWFWGEILRLWVTLLGLGFVVGMVLAVRRRAWSVVIGGATAAALALLGALSVSLQLKFWSYHWVVLTPFLVLGCAYGIAELAYVRRELPMAVAVLALAIGYIWAPRWATSELVTYRSYSQTFWDYVRGDMRRSAFLQQFTGPFGYSYAVQEHVGNLIGELAKPGDTMQVRGFEPAIYVHAGLASPSRFASEAPLTGTGLTFNHEAWIAEHERSLWTNPPRFFVTFVGMDPDIAALEGRGYHRAGQYSNFLWLERNAPAATTPGPTP